MDRGVYDGSNCDLVGKGGVWRKADGPIAGGMPFSIGKPMSPRKAAMNGVLRSHSLSTIGNAGKRSGSTVQEMQSDRGADKLPVEDFEDLSLVFPREAKR